MSRTSASWPFAFPQAILLSLTILQIASGPQVLAQTSQSSAAERRRFAAGWTDGTPITVTGEVLVFHTDDFANRRATVAHMIRDQQTGRSFQLLFENGTPRTMRSGATIRVAGRSLGSEIYVAACCDGATSSNMEILSEPTTGPSGDQRTLVMVADLFDADVSCSDADITSTVFAPPAGTFDANGTGLSINAEYLDSSHGKVSWSGQLQRSRLNISSTDACDLSQYSQTLDAQAAASGIDVGSYPHKLYVFPPMSQCPFVGASTLGGTPSSTFSFSCSNRGLYAHELGHALGMSHAAAYYSAYTAGSGDFDNRLNEYGDYSDSMGASGWQLPGFNAPHREQMGWLPSSGAGATQIVTQSGQYQLSPLSIDPSTASAPQVIKIPKADDGGHYYLSYRGGQTFDQYAASYATRVSVHRYGSPLDALNGYTSLYAALANGLEGEDTFTDPANGITVTMLSGYGAAPGSGAVVDVQINGASCVRTVPALMVSPQSQTGSAGGSPSYTISLTNDDAASCPTATFTLSGAVPDGWNGTLSPDTLTLIPGATGQAILTVTASAGSQAGTYTSTVNTSDAAAPVHATSTVAAYTVLDDTLPPSDPVSLTATLSNKLKQVKLSWAAAVDNVGVVEYLVSRNGSIVGRSTTTSWTDAEWLSGATYTYFVAAKDAAGNVSGPSNSATVTLPGGGKKR